MYNSGYFFSKYIDINLSANFKKNNLSSSPLFFTPINNNKSNCNFVHFVFQYNFLNTNFMSSLRSKFFKYQIVITSSKKSVLKFILPTHFKNYFSNSSFIVSFPAKSYLDTFTVFTLLKDYIDSNVLQTNRFSSFPIAIFINNFFIPIEYFYFFFSSKATNIFFNNVSFCSFIVINSYFKQIFTLNNIFSRNGNN